MSDTPQWKEDLQNIFHGYLGHDSVEDAAYAMVFVSEDHPEWHQRFMTAFNNGEKAALEGDTSIVPFVHDPGGVYARNVEDALRNIMWVRSAYMAEFENPSSTPPA